MPWSGSSEHLVSLLEAELLVGKHTEFSSWGTDTRKNLSNSLFIALKGASFDAHDFLITAIQSGAKGLLIHRDLKLEELEFLKNHPQEVSVLKVTDTLVALQSMARDWRKRSGFGVLAVTGTNGKTTTKEFCKQLLSEKYKVYAPEGSLNNHWGVPFALLSADADCQWVFCEMGMNHSGEISSLCEIALPDIVGVTMVGRGHLEGMGSLEAIALEKSQIYRSCPKAKKVFNIDNPFTEQMREDFFQEGDLCFSMQKPGVQIQMQIDSSQMASLQVSGRLFDRSFSKEVPVFGPHNITNIMMAAGLCVLAGMNPEEIIDGLSRLKMAWGRNQVEEIAGYTVVFDAYNANPESMGAFLNNAHQLKISGKKHLVLGDMLELGDQASSLHRELAEKAKNLGFDGVHFFGLNFKQFQGVFSGAEFSESCVFSDTYKEDLAMKIRNMLQPGDAVFIKASRGMRMERFLNFLKN